MKFGRLKINHYIDENLIKMKELGIGGLVFLIFMVLKLTGNIDWSWWWITAPLWIPITLVIILQMILNRMK